ncbi:asparaginase domain-containing protein [Nocardia goodfellowii]
MAAIQTAAHPHFRDQGALVVFADEVHAARRVRRASPIRIGKRSTLADVVRRE